ncbi:MAG: helix-turn-helix domain-containing protein [Thiobacillus sp.]|nr:helix-turn-helix domain-containing protein [Thiobacillus sp.]
MSDAMPPLRVSLIALPEGAISTLHGLYDVLSAFELLAGFDAAIPTAPPFRVEIVGAAAGLVRLASGLTAHAHRGIADVAETDIVIVPSVVLPAGGWQPGRYPELVEWLARAHARGAHLCSACSGVFLLAETGLFDARDATVHWAYASAFHSVFPDVRLFPERALVAAGERSELVTSGASMSWHDLVLYLIARHVGPTAAQAMAKFFALQWHRDGLGPYVVFEGRRDHGDAAVLAAQDWLEKHYPVAAPVEEMVRRSGIAQRTFKRRFTEATGLAPLPYVQQLRVAEAKRRLERTREAVDEIGWRVGYEDPAFFRRLFKRITGVSPAGYRRQFQIPLFDADGPRRR